MAVFGVWLGVETEAEGAMTSLADQIRALPHYFHRKPHPMVSQVTDGGKPTLIEGADVLSLLSSHEQAQQESWRCFKCGMLVTDEAQARRHFNAPNGPECVQTEQMLIKRLTMAEDNLRVSQRELQTAREELANLDKAARELLDNARGQLRAAESRCRTLEGQAEIYETGIREWGRHEAEWAEEKRTLEGQIAALKDAAKEYMIYLNDGEAPLGTFHSMLLKSRIVTLACNLLPAPPVPPKCDGNHAGPRCADPECWNQ